MNAAVQIMIATSFSLLITFTLYTITYEKRATNSLFQDIVADTFHLNNFLLACLINQRSMRFDTLDFFSVQCYFCIDLTSCFIPHNTNEKLNKVIVTIGLLSLPFLGKHYDYKIVFRLLLGLFVISNVWLLARSCSSFDLWYPVDIFTVYLLVWQFSYLIFQWCSHQLSWFHLIFYQASVCIYTAVMAFICYDLFLRYFPSAYIGLIWYACLDDV